MSNGTVTVIIPIYNVEKYLRPCLDSVLGQTYQDLQIILVDDGSTDSCGLICEEYAARDPRITVVHKENGGLSDARNAGLPLVEGEFVFYLDSDDYLVPHALERLVNTQRERNADVVLGNFFYTFSDREYPPPTWCKEDTLLNNREAMEALIDGRIETFAWGKLIRRDCAVKYPFPKGKVFEDHFWTHFVFGDADKVALVAEDDGPHL